MELALKVTEETKTSGHWTGRKGGRKRNKLI